MLTVATPWSNAQATRKLTTLKSSTPIEKYNFSRYNTNGSLEITTKVNPTKVAAGCPHEIQTNSDRKQLTSLEQIITYRQAPKCTNQTCNELNQPKKSTQQPIEQSSQLVHREESSTDSPRVINLERKGSASRNNTRTQNASGRKMNAGTGAAILRAQHSNAPEVQSWVWRFPACRSQQPQCRKSSTPGAAAASRLAAAAMAKSWGETARVHELGTSKCEHDGRGGPASARVRSPADGGAAMDLKRAWPRATPFAVAGGPPPWLPLLTPWPASPLVVMAIQCLHCRGSSLSGGCLPALWSSDLSFLPVFVAPF